MSLVNDLANAIKRFENVNPAYNNPGAIFDTKADKLKRYDTYDQGWNALIHQVNLNIGRGLTLREFFAGKPGVYPGYAPRAGGIHSTNNPDNYAETVAGWLGISPDVPLNGIGSGRPADSVMPIPSGSTTTTTPTLSPTGNTGIDISYGVDLPTSGDYWSGNDGSSNMIIPLALAAIGIWFVMR